MKKISMLEKELTHEERNLLSVAYKKITDTKRSSYRIISEQNQVIQNQMPKEYLKKIEGELVAVCRDVLV